MVQTLTVTNSTGGQVTGPINIVISSLSSTVTLTNLPTGPRDARRPAVRT
jgi:hypothetical protein